MKKHRTEKLIQITLIGPSENKEQLIKDARKSGYSDTSGSIRWRAAFPEHDKSNDAGVCLAGARHREGLTEKALSEKTGISQKDISEMENGKKPISKKTAQKFGEILNVDYRVLR